MTLARRGVKHRENMNVRPKSIIEGRERGVVVTEFVLMAPLIIFLLFLMVDLGWLLKNWLVITNAARESTRCAIASSCKYDYKDGTGPEEVPPNTLARARIWSGGMSWDHNGSGRRFPLAGEPEVDLFYVDNDDSDDLNEGDSLVVCIEALSNYITPVVPFFSFVTGGGVLPDPVPLKAKEEMLIEFADPDGPLFDDNGNPIPTLGDGKCPFDP